MANATKVCWVLTSIHGILRGLTKHCPRLQLHGFRASEDRVHHSQKTFRQKCSSNSNALNNCQWTFHRLTYIITSLNGFLWLLLSCNLQECDLPPAGPAKAKPKTPAEAELLQLLGAVGIHVLGEPGASKSVQPPGWIGSFCGCTAASAAMASAEARLI